MTAAEPRPASFLDVLDQDELWWPTVGPAVRLEDMGPRHKRNTLAFIRRLGPTASLVIAASTMDASDSVLNDVLGMVALPDWIGDLPLTLRLRDLIAADEAAGVPDEPDARVGQPLPCVHWCLICAEHGPITEPGAPLPCASCHDCTWQFAAADDATWD